MKEQKKRRFTLKQWENFFINVGGIIVIAFTIDAFVLLSQLAHMEAIDQLLRDWKFILIMVLLGMIVLTENILDEIEKRIIGEEN